MSSRKSPMNGGMKSRSFDNVSSNIERTGPSPPRSPPLNQLNSSLRLSHNSLPIQTPEKLNVVQNPVFRGRTFLAEFLTKDWGAVTALSELILNDENNALTESLLEVFEASNKGKKLLTWAISKEIQSAKSVSTIFRDTNEAVKFLAVLYHKLGRKYLESVVGSLVRSVTSFDKEVHDKDLFVRKILPLANELLDRLFSNIDSCPSPLRRILGYIKTQITMKFPDVPDAGQTIVCYLFFSRFLNPALVSPELYGLAEERPPLVAQRALILCSKLIQNLSTGMEFEDTRDDDLNRFVRGKLPNLRSFIDNFANLEEMPERLFHVSTQVNQAALIKISNIMKENKSKIHSVLTRSDSKMSFLQIVNAELFIQQPTETTGNNSNATWFNKNKRREREKIGLLHDRVDRNEVTIRKLQEQVQEQRENLEVNRKAIYDLTENNKKLNAENQRKNEEVQQLWEIVKQLQQSLTLPKDITHNE
eukprot:TRINITY_DN8240_c0_g1_i1.p1 TRINITY_DN8240_c0_g1~~TRINITY_DN8240_c0_g1_i1.p1  ORF type:complete len:476 (-),score=132.01 TRINITY_DN8240_c0_g1_i1:30-1457(-)